MSTPFDEFRAQAVAEISALQARCASLEASASSRPKPRLQEPEKLTGPSRWDTWLPLIKAKLRIDGGAIGDREAQFFYVYGNLDVKVQSMVLPLLHTSEDKSSWEPNSILEHLKRIFDNPNKKEEAAARLQSVRQGGDSLANYLAKFERLLHEAGAQTWPSEAKIALLRAGVNDRLRQKLNMQLSLPGTYDKFMQALQTLGGGGSIRYDNNNKPGNRAHHTGAGAAAQRGYGEPMDLSQMDAGPAIKMRGMKFKALVAPTSTPEEREARRARGDCVRCGDNDHWVRDCHYEPARDGPDPEGVLDQIDPSETDDYEFGF